MRAFAGFESIDSIMVYLKCVLTGLGAAALVAMLMGLWAQGVEYKLVMSVAPGDSPYVVAHWHRGLVFLGLLVVFAAGFWWQYRKGR
jgi:hypothetical protein